MAVVALVVNINHLFLLHHNPMHNQANWAGGRDTASLVVWCGGVRGLCELDGCVNSNSVAAKSDTIHYGIRLSVL